MCSGDLSQYDIKPKYMLNYIRYHGYHFNKQLCDFASSKLYKYELTKKVKVTPYTKEEVDNLLKRYNVKLNNNKGYDHVYVANMCKADYYGSSITDDKHVALYIKDTIDDEDAADGTTMRRWYATMVANGVMVDWDDSL